LIIKPTLDSSNCALFTSCCYNMLMYFIADAYLKETFKNVFISDETLNKKTFEECYFDHCSFINCQMAKCKFINCRFESSVFSAVIPMNCVFQVPRFFRCKLMGMDWTRSTELSEPDIKECQLNYSNFKLLNIPGAKIVNCEAKEVDFIETDLSKSDLRQTDFENSRFFKTNLSSADLRGAKNYSIDIKVNVLKKTRFSLPEAMLLLNSLDIIIE
jgi:fluoroquinolone resistance protein